MAADSGMIMFFMMFIAIAVGAYFFKDRIREMMGGGMGGEPMPPDDMPPEGDSASVGAFTQDLMQCASRCSSCDDVIDPNTGQVYWHAARSNDEKRCFSCLKDKCKFLFPGDPEVIIKKYFQTKVIKKEVPVPTPVGGSDRTSKEKSPRSSSSYARRIW